MKRSAAFFISCIGIDERIGKESAYNGCMALIGCKVQWGVTVTSDYIDVDSSDGKETDNYLEVAI